MITHRFDDLNSPLQVVDGRVQFNIEAPVRPRIQYVASFLGDGVVVAVQLVSNGVRWLEVLVNPYDERGRDILYRLSKQEGVMIGTMFLSHPPLVRRELAQILERSASHPVTRPQWDRAIALYKEGE